MRTRTRGIRLTSFTSTVHTLASATSPRKAASTFTSGGSNRLASGDSLSIFRRAHQRKSRNVLLSFRALRFDSGQAPSRNLFILPGASSLSISQVARLRHVSGTQ
jgi:hypothetical protein